MRLILVVTVLWLIMSGNGGATRVIDDFDQAVRQSSVRNEFTSVQADLIGSVFHSIATFIDTTFDWGAK